MVYVFCLLLLRLTVCLFVVVFCVFKIKTIFYSWDFFSKFACLNSELVITSYLRVEFQ